MILFLSKYPETQEDLRDGMFQRIIHIDSLFPEKEKVYLAASPYRYFKKTFVQDKNTNTTIIKCNLILHLGLILSLYRNATTVYIHSIHNLLYQFMFFLFFNKKYILDLHGLVPEEFEMEGDIKRSIIFNRVEKCVYSKLTSVVAVSQRLANHYRQKYPDASPEYIIYPIIPNNLQPVTVEEINESLHSETVNFIYSGNLQAWQNIDLMLESIKKLSKNTHYFFQILTGQVEEMKERFREKNINLQNVDIRGVKSEELGEYYKKAHYGFVLRDNIAVNNVACPTKLIEYMNYGIIPIVLSDEIGDFKQIGYENVTLHEISDRLERRKSFTNIEIVQKICADSKKNRNLIRSLE